MIFVMIKIKRLIKFSSVVAIALGMASSAISKYEPPSEAEISTGYRERAERVIDEEVAFAKTLGEDQGGMFTIAAALSRGEHLDWARARLRSVNNPPSGSMFWMHPIALVMLAGADSLKEEDWEFVNELWRTYFPYRGDTENHWIMYYVSLYLVCELRPDADGSEWYNGKSSQENMAEAKEYILDWVHITTSYGQGEYDSPNYIEEYTRPMGLLAGWAKDDALRQVGEMMMDYLLLDYAVENLDGAYGGAHSRLYPRYLLQPSLTGAAAHGWLFFDQGDFRRNATNTLVALSGYEPPSILYHIANDRDEAYIHKELKRTRWRLRNTGEEEFEIDGKKTKRVYKYSYMHPDYILGSSQGGILQPIQQQTWSLIWKEEDPSGKTNTMFGVQPYSNPHEGTMYFPADWDMVTDLIARSKVDYDSPDKMEGGSPYEQVFQHKSALIALYDIEEGSRFPLIHTLFSRDLKERIEDRSGWIFGRASSVYLAFRPFKEGEWKPVDWTGLLKGGAGGWFSTNFEELAEGSQCYVSHGLKNGYILQVASVDDFASYKAFQDKITQLPLEFSLNPVPTVKFTSLEGVEMEGTYGERPRVDGKPLDYERWKLFDGPFASAQRNSEDLMIRYKDQQRTLDFNTLTTETTIGK